MQAPSSELVEIFENFIAPEPYCEVACAARPDLAPILAQATKFHSERLFFQFTEASEQYLRELKSPIEAIAYFHRVMYPIRRKLATFSLVVLLNSILKSASAVDALEVFSRYNDIAEDCPDSKICFLSEKVRWLIKVGEIRQAQETLDVAEKIVAQRPGARLAALSAHHRSLAAVAAVKDQPSAFYHHMISYLSYTSVADIEESWRPELAKDVIVAALISDDVYNFGEMLQFPLAKFLEASSCEFLVDFLNDALTGDIRKFREHRSSHATKIASETPILHSNIDAVERKITVLALMELAFTKPSTRNAISFDEINEYCNVDSSETERLVMAAMNRGLVKGTLDGVDRQVSVTWIRPRILDDAKIRVIQERVSEWKGTVKGLLTNLEETVDSLGIQA